MLNKNKYGSKHTTPRLPVGNHPLHSSPPSPNPFLAPIPVPFPVPVLILSLLFFFLTSSTSAQQPLNPSFEGTPGWSEAPPDWIPCKYNSTPDTQPEELMNVTKPASDGNTYLGLVTRGQYGDNKNSTEAIGTWLTEPFEQNGCYTMIVDLHLSNQLGHVADWTSWQSYNTPVKLKVWGGAGECQYSELLIETGAIWDSEWTTYEFPFQPQRDDLDYIILEVDWIEPYTYYGNLMIDNIRLEQLEYDFSLGSDTTVCFNDVVKLTADPGFEVPVIWQDGFIGKEYEVSQPGTYWAVAGEGDCTSSDTIVIDYKECVRCNFWIPTIFAPSPETPLLRPRADCDIMEFHLLIYNTMGQLVYESRDFHEGWDGKAGQLVTQTNLYIYNVTYTAEDWGIIATKNERGKIVVINRYH